MSAGKSDLPRKEDLVQAVDALQKAAKAQDAAKSLREKASAIADPKQRERMIQDAYENEVEAHGQSKLARRLQSGTWQGLAGGTGIGAGVGMGVGTVVGVVTGGLVSLPTTALGALIGSGVGAVHGPWIKLGGRDRKLVDVPPEELVDAAAEEKIEQNTDNMNTATTYTTPSRIGKKQPRKLEIRSRPKTDDNTGKTEDVLDGASHRGGPKKLERRSSGIKPDRC
ncbi:uncharacterized protein RCC_03118 [Ramularia collo-cygni]|uniref:Glycine zipper domain-containing protein n=1 Tax=Ramularia collo-cygni TaxID=112498 RepID=A0A2D3V469_9PEZI|nr:uncharacterized protein RCC_03118 [Ramularia collo-cygni]CZT17284.1 uncharacterized protein RCC_03118 [Ramularia collo-cygni]